MTPALHTLLLGMALLLALGGLLGLSLLKVRERRVALQRRIDAIAPLNERLRAGPPTAGIRRMPAAPQPRLRQLGRLFGFDPAGSDEGLRWYFVLPATLAIAVVGSEFTSGLLGQWRLLLVPPCWVLLSRALWGWRRESRQRLLLNQFPDALAMVVRSVRVGIPVSTAIGVVVREAQEPTARCFRDMMEQLAIGVPLDSALRQMAGRVGLPEYRFFATTVALQAQTGGGLTGALENLADVIRKRVALRARAHALSAEARTSGAVLAVLPGLVGGLLYVLNPGYIALLFTDPSGQRMLGVAGVSLALGLITMRAIIRRALM